MALTNEFGFSIGGIHSSNYNIKIIDIHRNVLPEISENLLNIPARKGSYFTGLTVQHKVIQIEVKIVATSHSERLQYVERIAYWLLNNTNADQEIVFDDATDRVYYGHVANSTSVARSLFYGKATIEIHCSDPFAYGTSQVNFSADNTGLFTIDNLGSAPIYPIFTSNFTKDSSFISYTSPRGSILVGQPSDASLPSSPATEYVLNDDMLDFSSWTTTGATIDNNPNYVIAGALQQGSNGVIPSSFGTPTAGSVGQWHGAAIRKNLPSTVKDFTVKAALSLSCKLPNGVFDAAQLGRIEVYLYDANNLKIGKMVLTDGLAGFNFNIPSFHMGSSNTDLMVINPSLPTPQTMQQKDPVYYTVVKGDNLSTIARRFGISLSDLESINGIDPNNTTIQPGQRLKVKDGTLTQTIYSTDVGNYNDFYGQLSIQRIGTTWYAEIKRLDNGNNSYLKSAYYYDTAGNQPQSELAYIVIWMAQMDSWQTCTTMAVNDVKVIKNNTVDSTQNTTIFHNGDELVVDTNDSSVRLNGDLIMNQLDIGSTFFSIDSGTSQVRVQTDDTNATHTVTYTPRYL